MGHFSVEIWALPGSLLNGNQQSPACANAGCTKLSARTKLPPSVVAPFAISLINFPLFLYFYLVPLQLLFILTAVLF
jgi:hypothetical protein